MVVLDPSQSPSQSPLVDEVGYLNPCKSPLSDAQRAMLLAWIHCGELDDVDDTCTTGTVSEVV